MSPSTRRREQLPAINRNAARDQSELPPAIIGMRTLQMGLDRQSQIVWAIFSRIAGGPSRSSSNKTSGAGHCPNFMEGVTKPLI